MGVNLSSITIRKSSERGRGDRDWLKSCFSFSFGTYNDPANMGFRALRVLNDDRIAPGKGFGPHAHRDMEILTYVIEGKLLHRDSMGEEHILGPNEIQMMSAGNGIIHSEWNASESEAVHSLQIWILPEAEDLTPSYQQIGFAPEEKRGTLRLLVAPAKTGNAPMTVIRQDARVYVSELGAGESVKYAIDPDRHAWIQMVRGDVSLNGRALSEGDAAAVSGESTLSFSGAGSSGGEFLLFDLA